MSSLQRAIEIALEAHRGQVDKVGALYILHPLRVMLSLPTDEAKIVGVLHDVIEDCDGWSFERLRQEGFSEEVIDAVDAVTKRRNEKDDYFSFVERASRSEIGRQVKIADLRDNLNLGRIPAPTAADHDRINRYREALRRLGAQ